MSKTVSYKAIFVYDSTGISVFFPALPGCCTCGRSDIEAKLMAQDAIKSWCEATIKDLKRPLPEDFTMIDISNWIKAHEKNWKMYSKSYKRWTMKTIKVNLEV